MEDVSGVQDRVDIHRRDKRHHSSWLCLKGLDADHLCSSQSTALNTSRIKVLQSRNDKLEDLFEQASKDVTELSQGEKYGTALENFILEVSEESWSLCCMRCLPQRSS